MSLPLLLRVSKSCPRLLINMEKAGQVSRQHLYHLTSAFVLAVFVCVSVIHAVCVCALRAGWSSARVARFWWRDGLWLSQGIQVPQRWFSYLKTNLQLQYIKWAKKSWNSAFSFFKHSLFILCCCHLNHAVHHYNHTVVPEDYTY